MHTTTISSARRSATGGTVWNRFRTAIRVMRERQALAAMPVDRLSDMGISELDRAREAGRPIWDLPNGR